MIHLDLFSGIGGFALAVDSVWKNAEHTFCEIDPYCQKLLKKRFPRSTIYGDIRQLGLNPNSNSNGRIGGDTKINATEDREQTLDDTKECFRIDILTGGFPCQPFSQEGKRRGTEDNRYLWPEMLRVIREFKPTWVIAENVRGLLTIEFGVVFEQVCADLEGEGYEVQPLIIPACAVNAPHRRDRVWFIAHSRCEHGSGTRIGGEPQGAIFGQETTAMSQRSVGDDGERVNRHPISLYVQGERKQSDGEEQNGLCCRKNTGWHQNWLEVATAFCRTPNGLSSWLDFIIGEINNGQTKSRIRRKDLRALWEALQSQGICEQFGRLYEVQDAEVLLQALCELSENPQRSQEPLPLRSAEVEKDFLRELWCRHGFGMPSQRRRYSEQFKKEHRNTLPQVSYEVALAVTEAWHCVRLAQKIYESEAVELDGFKLSKSKHRVERLKVLGNSIVPQVAIEIMRAIKEASQCLSRQE